VSTLTQLEYALAVGRVGSFSRAALECFVTQPALSMQIHKLEDELGARLFDRSARPIALTEAGELLLPQFQRVVDEHRRIDDVMLSLSGALGGSYRLGIIPTVAPSLLPRFLSAFGLEHPSVELTVRELTTAQIVDALRRDELDGGVLATPLNEDRIREIRLYDEPLLIYRSPHLDLPSARDGAAAVCDLPIERMVLLSEGHCLRTQVLDICALQRDVAAAARFRMETASVSTLLRVVDQGEWFTVLPALAVEDLPGDVRATRVLSFVGETPFREIALVTRRTEVRSAIRDALSDHMRRAVPKDWLASAPGRRIPPT
jgi:LysR family transcriptional regulator, hydrogen peroxide-inducible genes activator